MKIFKVVIAGGSGFIGKYLTDYFVKNQTKVVVLTRNSSMYQNHIHYVNWDGKNLDFWIRELENSNLLINLTGKSIQCLFTNNNKKELLESRVNSVNVLSQAIKYIQNPPKLWIQASGLGFYGNTKKLCNEFSKKGDGFLSDLIEQLEYNLFKSSLKSTRMVALRLGLAFHNSGGIMKKLVKLIKNFTAVSVGNGEMYISWFHLFDLIRIIEFLFENDSLQRVFNVCSPNLLTNKDFMKKFRTYFGRPNFPHIPEFIFKLIFKNLMQLESELILNSQQIIPKNLLDLGFKFAFDDLQYALLDLYPREIKM